MRRTILLAAAVLLLSGCGIPTTGVIQSGDPATGIQPKALIFFVADGRVVPAVRELTNPVDVRTAVQLLLAGPDMRDRQFGLTTALTRIPAPTISASGAEVRLQLAAGTGPLSPLATRQLVCTAAAARQTEDPDTATTGVTVVVSGPDGRPAQGSSQCPIPRPAANSTETPAHPPGG
ncbi:hypothetical protein ACPC54_40560 [Kitasatospora sp. NPDC094028]